MGVPIALINYTHIFYRRRSVLLELMEQQMECNCVICNYSKSDGDSGPESPELNTCGDIYPVTHDGKPSGKLLAFICARCLRRANDMRGHVKSILNNVHVSRHAMDRFIERQAGEHVPLESAKLSVIKMFSHAKKIVFRDRFMAERLTNHHGKPADYFYQQGYIFVVTRELPTTIITIERQWHRKLGKDFWYAEAIASDKPATASA